MLTCKDCVYYEKTNDEWYYCEFHNDLFRDEGLDGNWCTKFASNESKTKEEQKDEEINKE